MRKVIPIILWLLVIAVCGTIFIRGLAEKFADGRTPGKLAGGSSANVTEPSADNPPGAAIVEVPWKHLPDVPQFDFIDQEGKTFDSAKLYGRPYAVCFFFATCPSICRELNEQVKRLNDQLRKEDVFFISITVDAKNDTPEVLGRYAQDYNAKADRWAFVTDQQYKIDQLGEQVFQIVVDKETHCDNILLMDKWGRYRDRFKWDDPYDMKRFVKVAKELADEDELPLNKTVRTRNAMAGIAPRDIGTIPWIREFHMTERSGEKFFSRELIGQVWIANFFFASCPGICKDQNKYLRGLQKRWPDNPAKIVSITTRPNEDTVEQLRGFAKELNADPDNWLFCRGVENLAPRVAAEFFGAHGSPDHHTSRLFVVDKWGVPRGDFDWQKPTDEIAMRNLVERLSQETVPPRPEPKKKRVRPIESEEDLDDEELGDEDGDKETQKEDKPPANEQPEDEPQKDNNQ